MMWRIFFALNTAGIDETFSKNRVTNSKNISYLQYLLPVFYVEY